MRIPERLRPLIEDGLVQEVVQPLMSGKEASVFVVFADGDYRVAKIYKEATERSFRNRAGYAEGRRIRNSRQRRAMEKGSRYGKQMMEEAWQNAEVDALYKLSEAGVRVPKPHQYVDGVLLMDVVLDPEGNAAPRLFDVDLTEEDALEIHAFLIRQIVIMLCAGLVHGDLSECNVLLAWDGPVIIDLPQATDAAHNPNARHLFLRDVSNLTRYLSRFAPSLAETRYGEEIWSLYERSELHPDTPLTGRWAQSRRRANTAAVLDEIADAAREARRIRAARGDDRPVELDLPERRPREDHHDRPPAGGGRSDRRARGERAPEQSAPARRRDGPREAIRGEAHRTDTHRTDTPRREQRKEAPRREPREVSPPREEPRRESERPRPVKPDQDESSGDIDLDDLDSLLLSGPKPRRR